MKIIEQKIKVGELVKGFDIADYNSSDEDIFCYDGKLNCRPAYQRNYVYDDERKAAVIETILKGYPSKTQFPLSIMYWAQKDEEQYELLDGQQRTISICLFRWGESCKVTDKDILYVGLDKSVQEWFNNYELTIYICQKDSTETMSEFESSLKEWFQIINTAGMELTDQEKRNAIYYGQWLSSAKELFSNKESRIFKDKYEIKKYIKIDESKMNRQEFLEKILKWKSEYDGISIDAYMSKHRDDSTASDLFDYLLNLIKWAKEMFPTYNNILYGQNWGYLYNKYKNTGKPSEKEREEILASLMDDDEIVNKSGIIEYILSNKNEKYLNFREFDRSQKQYVFNLQKGVCPLCKEEHDKDPIHTPKYIYSLKDMEADHIIPWSKGGKTTEDNCCMLCKAHNRAKGSKEIKLIETYAKEIRDEKSHS